MGPPGPEANGDNLGMSFFYLLYNNGMLSVMTAFVPEDVAIKIICCCTENLMRIQYSGIICD